MKTIQQYLKEVDKQKLVNEYFYTYPINLNDIENAILENIIGEFGVCIDDLNQPYKFRYLIGGTYKGGKVPEKLCGERAEPDLYRLGTVGDRRWQPGSADDPANAGGNGAPGRANSGCDPPFLRNIR